MQIIKAAQGSPEWIAARAECFTASEAPAMLGLSKYKTRQDLIREKATGYVPEIDAAKQRLFNAGHASEAAARPLVEDYLQEDLYPVTGSAEIDGLPLLASFDGLTADDSVVWENKLSSDTVLAMMSAGDLDGTYWPQVEQQLLVSGAARCLFTACDGETITGQLWYEPKPERRAQLIAGWKQFAADVAGYTHVEVAAKPTAAPIADLPALTVEISGRVLATNLEQWKAIVTDRIAGISTDLQTDTDFANAKATVKFLDDGEKRIALVKAQAQSQATDIDTLFRALDDIAAEMRAKRLQLDKLVTKREADIKIEIMQEGKTKFAAHIAGLNKRLATVQMPPIAADFAAAIKSKRTIESLRNAVDTLLSQKKIEANEIADRIQINLATLDAEKEFAWLFNDRAALVMKAADDLALVIKSRISEFKENEIRRIAVERAEMDRKMEAERERITAEERAKIEQEQAAQAKAAADARRFHDITTTTAHEVFAPATGITGTAKLREEIDDLMINMSADELQRVLDAVRDILSVEAM